MNTDNLSQPIASAHQPVVGAPYSFNPVEQFQQHSAPVPGYSVGKIRSTGVCMLLAVVTMGIYTLVWFYKTHEEMKRHTNTGLGGGLAFVLAFFVGIVMPFITASEVGGLYERRGLRAPVSGATGLWYLLLAILVVGPIIWFVKVNGALNAYWRSVGAR